MKFSNHIKIKTWVVSILAITLFLIPIYYNGQWTIVLGIGADFILDHFNYLIPYLVIIVAMITLVFSTYGTLVNRKLFSSNAVLHDIFVLNWVWYTLRLIGTIFLIMIVFNLGPEIITSDYTGGNVVTELVPILGAWLFLAAFLMPLLLNYGLMEFVGTFLERIVRVLFKVPGRSSIDALASWMGSAPVGVMITTKQYEKGFYTQREAVIIATNFSVLSIPFSLVIARFIEIDQYFLQFYATMAIAALFTAFVMVRIPPLTKKADTYCEGVERKEEDFIEGPHMFETAKRRAYYRTQKSAKLTSQVKEGLINVLDIYGALIPVVVAIGTVALILAEYTQLFTWLSLPVGFILNIFNIPEAYEAAPAFIIGITDMFLPSVIGMSIESELTRFIIACVSLTQVIYFSEVGALLLKSKVPISVLELIVIFVLRTIISFPIIYVLALLFVGY